MGGKIFCGGNYIFIACKRESVTMMEGKFSSQVKIPEFGDLKRRL